tara:strand:- start:29 stop:259 length:231 start_codon:yes stop_codon:yes gene_type:complete
MQLSILVNHLKFLRVPHTFTRVESRCFFAAKANCAGFYYGALSPYTFQAQQFIIVIWLTIETFDHDGKKTKNGKAQ